MTDQSEQLTIDEELETFDEWMRGLPVDESDQGDDEEIWERGAAPAASRPPLGRVVPEIRPTSTPWKQRCRPLTLRGIGRRWAEGPNSFEGFWS